MFSATAYTPLGSHCASPQWLEPRNSDSVMSEMSCLILGEKQRTSRIYSVSSWNNLITIRLRDGILNMQICCRIVIFWASSSESVYPEQYIYLNRLHTISIRVKRTTATHDTRFSVCLIVAQKEVVSHEECSMRYNYSLSNFKVNLRSAQKPFGDNRLVYYFCLYDCLRAHK